MFRHLARKAQMYGDKSFGVFGKFEGSVRLEKYTGAASVWIEANSKAPKQVAGQPPKLSVVEEFARSPVLLGHTRWPTRGAVTKTNCHPFHLGDWVAAHNGVIINSGELLRKAKLAPKGETDSEEALAYIVSENWSKESLCDISGGYAFAAVKKDLSAGLLICDDHQRLHYVKCGAGYVWHTDDQSLGSSLIAAGWEGDIEMHRLSNGILNMVTGTVEPIEVRHAAMTDWEREMLEGTRNITGSGFQKPSESPYRKPRQAGEQRQMLNGGSSFERPPYFTSKPLDLSIGSRNRTKSDEELAFEDEARQADIAAGEDPDTEAARIINQSEEFPGPDEKLPS